MPVSEQEDILDYAISLSKRQKFKQWNAIYDEEAAELKAEFCDEDLDISEAILSDYLAQLQQEDVA